MLCWLFLMVLSVVISHILLITLLFLEILAFFILLTVFMFGPVLVSIDVNTLSIILFSVLVIESVIGLFGILQVVSFTGSDYVGSSFTCNL